MRVADLLAKYLTLSRGVVRLYLNYFRLNVLSSTRYPQLVLQVLLRLSAIYVWGICMEA